MVSKSLVREVVKPPQDVADAHTLAAQYFAGFFFGHPFRQDQQRHERTAFHVSPQRWREPVVVADDCVLCQLLTDESAERRVAGFQWQLDIEATRTKGRHYSDWVRSGDPRVPEPQEEVWHHSAANLRRFVELFQNEPLPANGYREARPHGWLTRPLPIVDLPLRLKRKLCIQWNHILLGWMLGAGLSYDVGERVFYHMVEQVEKPPTEWMPEW